MLADPNAFNPIISLVKAVPAGQYPLAWVDIALGAALLILGRKLFWLFVGGVGFAAGTMLATQLFQMHSNMAVLILAAVFGIAGALLAIFLQKLAIGLAGFFGGIYLTNVLWQHSIWANEKWSLLAIFAGGMVGTLLLLLLFDWTLILLSSALGAVLIADSIPVGQSALQAAIAAILWILGIGIQFTWFRPVRKVEPT